jgi:plasmid stabilization system protein ParE
MIYKVRLLSEAEDDLFELHRYISRKSSAAIAENYVARIKAFLTGFDQFPHRGTVREDKRRGLRIVGFERRISVAFVVAGDEVFILRILYAGRQFRGKRTRYTITLPSTEDKAMISTAIRS